MFKRYLLVNSLNSDLGKELRKIWEEMVSPSDYIYLLASVSHTRVKGWKRNVKSRRFVITLQDHFREKVEGESDAGCDSPHEGDWARQFVSLAHIQSITEACSDYGSGYLTITSLNQFTYSLPRDLGWRLVTPQVSFNHFSFTEKTFAVVCDIG